MGIFEWDDRLVTPEGIGEIKDEDQFVRVLNYINEHGTFHMVPKTSCSFLSGERSPFFWRGPGGWLDHPHIKTGVQGRFEVGLDTIVPTPEMEECIISGTGILFIGPLEKLYDVWPIEEGAMYSVLECAGINCPALRRTGEKSEKDFNGNMVKVNKKGSANGHNKLPYPLSEKAERITRAYGLDDGMVKILTMDGYVLSFFSEGYVELPMKEVYDKQLKPWLNKNFPNHKFVEGEYSHRLMWASYSLGDGEMTDTIKGVFAHAGYNFNNMAFIMSVTSSDTRNSSVGIKLDIKADGIFIPLGKAMKFPHRGNITIKMIGESLEKALDVAKDSDKEFERLALIQVNHPLIVARKILKHDKMEELGPISQFFMAEIMDLVERLKGAECTGVDIYVAAVTALDKWKKEKTPSPSRFFDVAEAVTKKVLSDNMLERNEA